MKVDPKIVVACPTYGRIPFLRRMLASFLRQTYTNKHLVIVNDDKNVTLKCSYPNVSVINMDEKVILPVKRNISCDYMDCDIITQHDDDDIFYPTRLHNHANKYKIMDIPAYKNVSSYLLFGNEFYFKKYTSSPNDISYLKKTWIEVGGYQHPQTIGEDQEFFDKLKDIEILDMPKEADYVYNWGGINYHASYETDDTIVDKAEIQLKKMGIFGGTYEIYPDFTQYDKFVRMINYCGYSDKKVEVEHIDLGKLNIITKL